MDHETILTQTAQYLHLVGIVTGRIYPGTSPMVLQLRLHLPTWGVWVRSLVEELRSHTPGGQKTKKHKTEAICNKLNKDFKNDPHQKQEKVFSKKFIPMRKKICVMVCAASFRFAY